MSSIKASSPGDLVAVLRSELQRRRSSYPSQRILRTLFETLFLCSLIREETEPLSCHMLWLNPRNPDPNPPLRIRNNRWTYVPLARPIILTVGNLGKLFRASDPRTSSFAIYSDKQNRLKIWGLVDQGNNFYEMLTHNSDSGFPRPGLFQVSICGSGHLIVYIGLEKVAELHIDKIIRKSNDVMRHGPIRKQLQRGINAYISSVYTRVGSDVPRSVISTWRPFLEDKWIGALCRILLRIQAHRRGGALLICEGRNHDGLNIKYRMNYDRLRAGLEQWANHFLRTRYAQQEILSKYLTPRKGVIPAHLYLDEVVEDDDLRDADDGLNSVLWFISLLSRVDGLVLITPRLEVIGFGVEITVAREPKEIFLATHPSGRQRYLQTLDHRQYGMRHRSMLRLCARRRNAVGFVISQDGDVRAITTVGHRLVVWEDIRLQLDDFVRFPKRLDRRP